MRMVKHILPLLLSACLALAVLTACRDGGAEEESTSAEPTREVTVSVTEEHPTEEPTTSERETVTEPATKAETEEEATTPTATEAPTTAEETTTAAAGMEGPGVNTETGWSHFRPVG